jgi:hypothetical protein
MQASVRISALANETSLRTGILSPTGKWIGTYPFALPCLISGSDYSRLHSPRSSPFSLLAVPSERIADRTATPLTLLTALASVDAASVRWYPPRPTADFTYSPHFIRDAFRPPVLVGNLIFLENCIDFVSRQIAELCICCKKCLL